MAHSWGTGWGFWGMVLRQVQPHHLSMDNLARKPRVGDRVRIKGFLGVFEIVEVAQRGSMVDVKHLDLHHPAYIEKEVLWHELIYTQAEQEADPVDLPAPRPTVAAKPPRKVQVFPYRSELPANRRQQAAPRLAFNPLSPGS